MLEIPGLDRSTLEADLSSPGVAEFIGRYPELGEGVVAVLARAAAVRAAQSGVRPGAVTVQVADARRFHAQLGLSRAVDELEALVGDPGGDEAAISGAVRKVARALARVRTARHCFDPSPLPRPRAEGVVLARAVREFNAALEELDQRASAAGLARLPWVLELATHAAPAGAAAELEVQGYDTPRVPAAHRPWGERCVLSGVRFAVDSRRSPELRLRSTTCANRVLSPGAYHLVRRMAALLGELERRDPGMVDDFKNSFPFVFDEYLPDGAHPGLPRFGLTDSPNLGVVLNNALRVYEDRPLFGIRSSGGYRWLTFGQVRDRALALSRGLAGLKLPPGATVALMPGENCVEFYLVDFAAVFAGAATLTLPESLGPEATVAALRDSGAVALVVDRARLDGLLKEPGRASIPALKNLIVYSLDGEEGLPTERDPRLVSLADLEARGRSYLHGDGRPGCVDVHTPVLYLDHDGVARARSLGFGADEEEAVFTVMMTSGSTGEPKGAVFSRRRWQREVANEIDIWPLVVASFQPSALAADRVAVWQVLVNGGRVGFVCRGSGLLEDLRALRPTVLEAPPAFWNALYSEYRSAVADPGVSERAAAAVRERIRNSLGGRLVFAATGGAPSPDGVREAMEEVLGAPLHEGYGTSETGRIAANGVLLPGVEVRLLPVPELAGAAAGNSPHIGELAVRTPHLSTRYLAGDAAENEAFAADGYFRTGDLVELGPGRAVKVLGRVRESFKLAGGEFVNPGLVEGRLLASELVEAVMVAGLPGASRVVALAVPCPEFIGEEEVLADLQRIGRAAGLRPAEIPVGVVLAPRVGGKFPWTVENGLLTPSLKPRRRAIENRYRGEVERLLASVTPEAEAGALPDGEPGAEAVLDLVTRVAAAVLGTSQDGVDPSRSLMEHGADSLAAMEFLLRLERVRGAKTGARVAWRPDGRGVAERPLADVARELAGAEGPKASVDEVAPTPGANSIPASEMRAKGYSVGEEPAHVLAVRDARSVPVPDAFPPASESDGVVVTGATGFLGVHLLAHLATTLLPGTPLTALVRAGDHEGASRRLAGALEAAGLDMPGLSASWEQRGGVSVLAAHLDRERFGLSEGDYTELRRRTGLVFHLAAEVRGGAGYGELRPANVEAVRQVLRFVTVGEMKALHFVSTLNVTLLMEDCLGGAVWEETPLPRELPADVAARHPSYALTKWAAESMIQDLFGRSAGHWKASVSRPALLSWSGDTGFANQGDWLTLVLRSCLTTGLAIGDGEAGLQMALPRTAATAAGLDLVPVDFAAQAIARLGLLTRNGSLPPPTRAQEEPSVPTFHVSNTAPGHLGLVSREQLMDLLLAAHMEALPDEKPLRLVPPASWVSGVEQQGAAAREVLEVLRRPAPQRRRTPSERFTAAMGPAVAAPFIDVEYLRRFVLWAATTS